MEETQAALCVCMCFGFIIEYCEDIALDFLQSVSELSCFRRGVKSRGWAGRGGFTYPSYRGNEAPHFVATARKTGLGSTLRIVNEREVNTDGVHWCLQWGRVEAKQFEYPQIKSTLLDKHTDDSVLPRRGDA